MERLSSAVVLLLLVTAVTTAQTTAPKVSLDSLQFLIGNWEGLGQGGPGTGKGGFSFVFDLQNKIIVRKNYAEYAATENSPATRHEDLLIIYVDSTTNRTLTGKFEIAPPGQPEAFKTYLGMGFA